MDLFEQEIEESVDKKISWNAWISKVTEFWGELSHSKTGRRYLISGITYSVLVLVVLYGVFFDYVYDGFPDFVPWLVLAIFIAMAVIRFKAFLEIWRKKDHDYKKNSSGNFQLTRFINRIFKTSSIIDDENEKQ